MCNLLHSSQCLGLISQISTVGYNCHLLWSSFTHHLINLSAYFLLYLFVNIKILLNMLTYISAHGFMPLKFDTFKDKLQYISVPLLFKWLVYDLPTKSPKTHGNIYLYIYTLKFSSALAALLGNGWFDNAYNSWFRWHLWSFLYINFN